LIPLTDSVPTKKPEAVRRYVIRPEFARPTVAEVDLSAFAANVAAVRKHSGGAAIWAVVKADAYGHGAIPVSRALERAGVDGFAVALVEEGLELREAGISRPILVLGGLPAGSERDALEADLLPVVFESGQIAALAKAADGARIDAHVKIDTGMSRLGVGPKDLPAFLTVARRHPNVVLSGALTHLACPDDPEAAREQVARFDEALQRGRFLGLSPTQVHVASSAAIIRAPFARRDAVRPGLLLYGVSPAGAPMPDLRPAMAFKTRVLQVRTIAAGDAVGYGATHVADREARIATLPVGYADGVSRTLSSKGDVLVRGRRSPIVGSVCMDLTMIDVSSVPGVVPGDEVVLLGTQGTARIAADEIAAASGTIAYEVLTSVSRRVPRSYKRA
jgi:alanine racemase